MILRNLILAGAFAAKLSGALQPQARDPVGQQQIRDLEWGELNFLYVAFSYPFLHLRLFLGGFY